MGAAAVGFCCGRELRTNRSAENAERNIALVFNMRELQLDLGSLVRRERNVARLGEIFLQNGGIGVLQLGIVHREKLVVAGRKLGELEGGGGASQVKRRCGRHQPNRADLRVSSFWDD